MSNSFGVASRKELIGVHPQLIELCERSIVACPQDFSVYDGVRTIEQQQEYMRTGASKTMDSKHLIQPDGYSHAVDLVPFINGKLRWEWGPIYVMARTIIPIANEMGLNMTWGGIWDRRVRDLPIDIEGLQRAVKAYCDRHPGPDHIDGPHWQLER